MNEKDVPCAGCLKTGTLKDECLVCGCEVCDHCEKLIGGWAHCISCAKAFVTQMVNRTGLKQLQDIAQGINLIEAGDCNEQDD